MTHDATGQQDLRAYLRIFWRWKFLFLSILIVIPVIAYVIASGKKPSYQSSTLVELQDVTIGLGSSSAPIQTGNLAAVAQLVDTTPVAERGRAVLEPAPGGPGIASRFRERERRPDDGLPHDHWRPGVRQTKRRRSPTPSRRPSPSISRARRISRFASRSEPRRSNSRRRPSQTRPNARPCKARSRSCRRSSDRRAPALR